MTVGNCSGHRVFTGRVIEDSNHAPELPAEKCPYCGKLVRPVLFQQGGTPWGGGSASNWFVYLQKH